MTLAALLEAFDRLDLGELPDVHALDNDRAQILWLFAAIKKTGFDSLTAAEVSNLLRDRCGVAVSRQRVAGSTMSTVLQSLASEKRTRRATS